MKKQVAIGNFTEITDILAPSQAKADEIVDVKVLVKNLYSAGIYIAVTGRYDGTDFFFAPKYEAVYAGKTATFSYPLTMPPKDTTIEVWTFYWTAEGWYKDDYIDIAVSLKEEAAGIPWLPVGIGLGALALVGVTVAATRGRA